MPPSLKSSITTVNQLKAALLKEHEKGGKDHSELDTEKCLDLLSRLDEVPMNLPILSETLIGTAVSKLKSCGNDEVSAAAKKLVKKWKKCAKEGTATGARAERPAVASSSSTSSASAAMRKPAAAAAAAAAATSSSAKIEANVPDEWRDLPPNRRTMCGKLFELLSLSSSSASTSTPAATPTPTEVQGVATAIEGAISDHSKNDRAAYSAKARQLSFNLKKNSQLRLTLLRGDTPPSRLVTMSSEELATSEQTEKREGLEKQLQDSRRLDWEQANEHKINEMCGIKGDLLKASLFTCGRCKSIKTTSTQKQTRSADEPMTVFVFCTNCGNRWKC